MRDHIGASERRDPHDSWVSTRRYRTELQSADFPYAELRNLP